MRIRHRLADASVAGLPPLGCRCSQSVCLLSLRVVGDTVVFGDIAGPADSDASDISATASICSTRLASPRAQLARNPALPEHGHHPAGDSGDMGLHAPLLHRGRPCRRLSRGCRNQIRCERPLQVGSRILLATRLHHASHTVPLHSSFARSGRARGGPIQGAHPADFRRTPAADSTSRV